MTHEIWTNGRKSVMHQGYGPFGVPPIVDQLMSCQRFLGGLNLMKPIFSNVVHLMRTNSEDVIRTLQSKRGGIFTLSGDTGVGKSTVLPRRLLSSGDRIYVVAASELQARDVVNYVPGATLDEGVASTVDCVLTYTWPIVALCRLLLDRLLCDVLLLDEAHCGFAATLMFKYIIATVKSTATIVMMSATHPELPMSDCTHAFGMRFNDLDFEEEDLFNGNKDMPWNRLGGVSGHWAIFSQSTADAVSMSDRFKSLGIHSLAVTRFSTREDLDKVRTTLSDVRGFMYFVVFDDFYRTGFSFPGLNKAIDLSEERILVTSEVGGLTLVTVPVTQDVVHQTVGRIARKENTEGVFYRRKVQMYSAEPLYPQEKYCLSMWLSFLRSDTTIRGVRANMSREKAARLLSLPYRGEVLSPYFDISGRTYSNIIEILQIMLNKPLVSTDEDIEFPYDVGDGVRSVFPSTDFAHSFHVLVYRGRRREMKEEFRFFGDDDETPVDVSRASRLFSQSPAFVRPKKRDEKIRRSKSDYVQPVASQSRRLSDDARVITRADPVVTSETGISHMKDVAPPYAPALVLASPHQVRDEPSARFAATERVLMQFDAAVPEFVLPDAQGRAKIDHYFGAISVQQYLCGYSVFHDDLVKLMSGTGVLVMQDARGVAGLVAAFVMAWNSNVRCCVETTAVISGNRKLFSFRVRQAKMKKRDAYYSLCGLEAISMQFLKAGRGFVYYDTRLHLVDV